MVNSNDPRPDLRLCSASVLYFSQSHLQGLEFRWGLMKVPSTLTCRAIVVDVRRYKRNLILTDIYAVAMIAADEFRQAKYSGFANEFWELQSPCDKGFWGKRTGHETVQELGNKLWCKQEPWAHQRTGDATIGDVSSQRLAACHIYDHPLPRNPHWVSSSYRNVTPRS